MASRTDPYKGFRFRVEIDGIQQAGFRECSGLGSEIQVEEYREGNEKSLALRKLPGKVIYPDLVLKGGATDSRALYHLHFALINGKLEPKNGSHVLMHHHREGK